MKTTAKQIVGWREWAALPTLGIPALRVKIDTGAKTSALHASDLETFKRGTRNYVRFNIYPLQKNNRFSRHCIMPVVKQKVVKSSNGLPERRVTIVSPIRMGGRIWDIEITLTNRDIMNYRMLLGREAMKALIVDPVKSYYLGKFSQREILELYAAEQAVL